MSRMSSTKRDAPPKAPGCFRFRERGRGGDSENILKTSPPPKLPPSQKPPAGGAGLVFNAEAQREQRRRAFLRFGAGLVFNAERQRRGEAEGFSRVERVDRVVFSTCSPRSTRLKSTPGDISYLQSPIPYLLSAREARRGGAGL